MTEQLELAPLPESKATTAYELFEETIQIFEQEPSRVHMSTYIMAFKCPTRWALENKLSYADSPSSKLPACGTIGCIAGWMWLLRYGSFKHSAEIFKDTILILSGVNVDDLCKSDREYPRIYQDLRNLFLDDFPAPQEYGTPAYSSHVIRNMRAFMAKWEAELKARILPPAPAA